MRLPRNSFEIRGNKLIWGNKLARRNKLTRGNNLYCVARAVFGTFAGFFETESADLIMAAYLSSAAGAIIGQI